MSVIQSNQMGKGEMNPQNGTQDQTIDASLGLGGEDINWQTSPDLTSQEEKDVSVFDGYGNPTTPYSTMNRYINRRKISMHAIFYTQRDEYDAAWYVGRKDDPGITNDGNEIQFTQSLAGFDTDNQNKGIPTMQIYLFGLRDWEQILRPNDYCAVRVWEAYPDSPDEINGNTADTNNFPDDVDGIRKRTLMVGLISDIQMNEDPNSSAKVYTITCQGMQKVLADINLGLPKTAQWNDVNLLYDINGASNPLNEQFPTYGGGSSSSSSGSSGAKGSAKEVGGANEKAFISWCNQQGLSVAQTAGLMGNATVEAGGWDGTGNYFGISAPGTQTGEKANGNGSVEAYLNWTVLHKGHESYSPLSNCPSGFYKYKSVTKSMSAYKCADWWCDHIEITQASDADQVKGDAAESAYKEIS